jgi:hypothetical protein
MIRAGAGASTNMYVQSNIYTAGLFHRYLLDAERRTSDVTPSAVITPSADIGTVDDFIWSSYNTELTSAVRMNHYFYHQRT